MVDPNGWVLSGLMSNALDLARFGVAVLGLGRVGDVDLGCDVDYLQASRRPSQDLNPAYGYLWWNFGADRVTIPGLARGQVADQGKSFGGISIDRRLAPSSPVDAAGGMGAGNQRLFVTPSLDLVAVRLAGPKGWDRNVTPFDEPFWSRLMPALPRQ